MALRKRHQGRVESADAPVTSTPTAGAELPPKAEDKPAEQPAVESAVERATKHALQQRLQEMERAEGMVREAVQQQPQYATEPIQIEQEPQEQPQDPLEAFLASVPVATASWLRAHPEYMHDAEKNAALQHFHWAAKRETGEEFTPRYIESLERHLGLRQERPNGNGARQPTQPTVQRQAAPVRQQQHAGPPVSAPPTRDVPSMLSGRPASRRAPLTPAQREAARYSGISDQEYAEQLEKYEFQKQQGMHQDGRQ
jgi:hypothetical protein